MPSSKKGRKEKDRVLKNVVHVQMTDIGRGIMRERRESNTKT